jgi:hypothetical protein
MSLSNTEKHVKDIRRKTRRKFSSEEKIRIVLDGLRLPLIVDDERWLTQCDNRPRSRDVSV